MQLCGSLLKVLEENIRRFFCVLSIGKRKTPTAVFCRISFAPHAQGRYTVFMDSMWRSSSLVPLWDRISRRTDHLPPPPWLSSIKRSSNKQAHRQRKERTFFLLLSFLFLLFSIFFFFLLDCTGACSDWVRPKQEGWSRLRWKSNTIESRLSFTWL